MTDQPAEPIAEAPEPIDVRNNPESRAASSDASGPVARASDGGSPPRDAPPAGEMPEHEVGGARDGDPVSGVTISAADRENAVAGDDGPDGSSGSGRYSS